MTTTTLSPNLPVLKIRPALHFVSDLTLDVGMTFEQKVPALFRNINLGPK